MGTPESDASQKASKGGEAVICPICNSLHEPWEYCHGPSVTMASTSVACPICFQSGCMRPVIVTRPFSPTKPPGALYQHPPKE